MKTAPLSIYPDREMRLWLETVANQNDRPLATTVMRFLRREKKRQEKKRWPQKPPGA